jgi:hypothetical protein
MAVPSYHFPVKNEINYKWRPHPHDELFFQYDWKGQVKKDRWRVVLFRQEAFSFSHIIRPAAGWRLFRHPPGLLNNC